ncbi:DUF2493 domain-containing protein [Embleya sp. NPDC001921]
MTDPTPYRILITGSRDWRDQDAIRKAIQDVLDEFGPNATVDHGDAPGADRLGGTAAAELGLPVEKHPADWIHNGRRAGPIRNQHMVDLRPKICLAFPLPSSRGTHDCIGRARTAGIPVRIVQPAATGRADHPAPTRSTT